MTEGKLMQPRVCFLADFGGPYGGNFLSSALILQRNCRERGGELVMVFPSGAQSKNWAQSLLKSGVPLLYIQDRFFFSPFLSLLSILWKNQINIVHTHFTRFDIIAWVAAQIIGLFRLNPVRVIWHIHSDFSVTNTTYRKVKDFIKFHLMGRSSNICLVSEHLKERPLAAGFEVHRMFTIMNGIDLARLISKSNALNPLAKLNLKKRNTVLMFGWHPYIKGVDVALAAFEILALRRSDIALLIVGQKDAQEEIMTKYPQGNPSWLHLIPPIENVVDYLTNAGIFLSASRREGFPYSVVESIACGCRVVASDIPALQWMKGTIHSWWFHNENSIELADRIIECVSLPEDEWLKELAMNSEHVRKQLSVEKWADNMMVAYRCIIAPRN